MSRLLALYPRAWRARYGDEFAELLEARPPTVRDRLDIVIGAIDARINPQVPGAGDRERAVGGDRAARVTAVVTGVLLTIWGVIGATSMVPWDSGLEPRTTAEMMNLAWVSGMLGALLSPVAFGIVIVRYERVLGGVGLAGAVLTPLGLIMSALGMGIGGLLALGAGVILFSWRANGRILSAPVALAFAAGTLLAVASFFAFAASGGQEVNLLLPMVALGPSWILLGIGLRQPRVMPDGTSTLAPRPAGA
jgi:MFS family permease